MTGQPIPPLREHSSVSGILPNKTVLAGVHGNINEETNQTTGCERGFGNAAMEQSKLLNEMLAGYDGSADSAMNATRSRATPEAELLDQHVIHRRDSVATSTGSSHRRPKKHSTSRRSSTHSARPSVSRSNSGYNSPPRRLNTQEAIEIHRRSLSLFQHQGGYARSFSEIAVSSSHFESAPTSPCTGSAAPYVSSAGTPESLTPYTHSPRMQAFVPEPYAVPDLDEEDEDDYEPVLATTIHWNSLETRRRQYAEIDRVHSGLLGFWRKVAPRFLCPRVPGKFYNEKDTSEDGGSVRRHRIDLPADERSSASQEGIARPGMPRSLSCF